jgi:uncharacterized membrane protein YsdA (DUF1294 family)
MMITNIIIPVLIFNLCGFLLMGWDKERAKKEKWRVRESTFFWIALLGGAVGVWIGMKKFRHKTLHLSFRLGIPLCIVWNVFFLYFLWQNLS